MAAHGRGGGEPFLESAIKEGRMPIVHVYVWRGFSEEAKKRAMAGITKVFADMGIPKEAVEVLIHEVPKEDWGIGGEPASERLKGSRPP